MERCGGLKYGEKKYQNDHRSREINLAQLDWYLHEAAACGDIQAVEMLLKWDASINSADRWGKTALMKAAQNGFPRIVEALIKAGANYRATDRNGNSAFDYAIENVQPEVIKILLNVHYGLQNYDHSPRPLDAAIIRESAEIVKILIEAGADVNRINENGVSPLEQASCKENIDTLKILLEKGATRVNKVGADFNLLACPIRNGYLAIIDFWLTNGVNANASDDSGYSLAMLAVEADRIDIFKLLLKRGANPELTLKKDYAGFKRGASVNSVIEYYKRSNFKEYLKKK